MAREWLETNGGGSFALGTTDRTPQRRYHSLLTVREPGVGDPWNVIAEVAEELRIGDRLVPPLAFDFAGSDEHAQAPDSQFTRWPVPTLRYDFSGVVWERSVQLNPDADEVWLDYRFRANRSPFEIRLRPYLLCRPFHESTHENPWLNGQAHGDGHQISLDPYPGMPGVRFDVVGVKAGEVDFAPEGTWLRRIHYALEEARGYPAEEDAYSPGAFVIRVTGDGGFRLRAGIRREDDAATKSRAAGPRSRHGSPSLGDATEPSFREALERAGDQFLVQLRDGTRGVIAGYPWFGEWGRDTLISLPGLCLARGRHREAAELLRGLAARRVRGLVPNLPASGALPANTNSVDASLLFVRGVRLLAESMGGETPSDLMPLVWEILEALAERTDSRIALGPGLSVHTESGPWALTWMDAVFEGHPVTPRHGRAVEIDALMIEGVEFALPWAKENDAALYRRWRARSDGAREQFVERYWLEDRGFLADNHDGNQPDVRLRPNQLFALASPSCPLTETQTKRALVAIGERLLTPTGVRTLSPDDPEYQGCYAGDQRSRDHAYHQGTVWPWLLGPLADALRRIDGVPAVKRELGATLARLEQHLETEACIGQISEVFDGDAPHVPGGTPAQAWSVAEVYRVMRMVEGT